MKIMVNKDLYKALRGRSGLALLPSKKRVEVRDEFSEKGRQKTKESIVVKMTYKSRMKKAMKIRTGLALLPSKVRAGARRWQRIGEKAKAKIRKKFGRQADLAEDLTSARRASASSGVNEPQNIRDAGETLMSHLRDLGLKPSAYKLPSGFSFVRQIIPSQSEYDSILSMYNLPTDIIPKVRKSVNRSIRNLPEHVALLTPLQQLTKDSEIEVDIKRPLSIADKVDRGRSIETHSDHLRARIWIRSPQDVQRIDKWIRANHPTAKVDNKFHKPDEVWGYRKFHVDFFLKDGSHAELQVQPVTAKAHIEEAHALREKGLRVSRQTGTIARKLAAQCRAVLEPAYKEFFKAAKRKPIGFQREVQKAIQGKPGLALLPSKRRVGVRRWQRTTKKAPGPAKGDAQDLIGQARNVFDSLNNTVRLSMKRGHGWGDTSVEKRETTLRRIASQLEAEHDIKLDWMATGTPNAVFRVERLATPKVREKTALYEAPQKTETKVTNIPVSMIERNEKQPRKHFDPEALEELARSIETHGLQQPIVVRPHPGEKGKFQIVAGERRWRAHQLAKIDMVPSIIRHLTDKQTAEVALLENITREDLTPIEEGNAYRQMLDMDWTLEELSKTTGKSTSYVRSMMTLSNLVPEGQKLVENGNLKITMALRIASIPDHDLQRVALRRANKGDMSTEEFTLYVETLKTEQALLPLFGGELEEAKQLPRGMTRKRAKSIGRKYNELINDLASLVRRAINAKDFTVYPRVLQGELSKKIDQLEVIEKGVKRIRQELIKEQQKRGIIRRAEASERMRELREAGKLGKSTHSSLPLEDKISRLKSLLLSLVDYARQCKEEREAAIVKAIKGKSGLALLPSKKKIGVRRWQRIAEKTAEYEPGKRGTMERDVPFVGWKKGDTVEIAEVDSKHRAIRLINLEGGERAKTAWLTQEDVKLSPKGKETPSKPTSLRIKGKVQNLFLKLKRSGFIMVSGTEISGPEDAAKMFRFLKDSDREKGYIINMTESNEVLNVHLVSMGTLNANLVHPREAFKSSILSKAKRIYFIHNHPSGDATPSDDDHQVTARLNQVGKDLKIALAGSIVIGEDRCSWISPGHVHQPQVAFGPEAKPKLKVKVVEVQQKRKEAAEHRLSGEEIRSPGDAAQIARKILKPKKPMVGVMYLSGRNSIGGVEVLGSGLDQESQFEHVLKSSILHNAAGVIFLMTDKAKVDRQTYATMRKKLDRAGIELMDGVRCKGAGYVSDKAGEDIFKALRWVGHLAKAVVGGIRPGRKYIKREQSSGGRWRCYYYDSRIKRIVVQDEGEGMAKSKQVRRPGIRGGKFWISKKGYIRYGPRPKGPMTKERIARLLEANKANIHRSLRGIIRKYRLSSSDMDELYQKYSEGALQSLKQKRSKGIDEWKHAQNRGFRVATRWAQKQGPFKLSNPEQAYKDIMRMNEYREQVLADTGREPLLDEIAEKLGIKPARVDELLRWDRLKRTTPAQERRIVSRQPSPEELLEAKEHGKERQEAFNIVNKEVAKLPLLQRRIAEAEMFHNGKTGEQLASELGVSRAKLYQERTKMKNTLEKLRAIWNKFGKSLTWQDIPEMRLLKAVFSAPKIVVRRSPRRSS